MRCVTWSRDSHGLFDYESRYINKKNIKTRQAGRIVRLDNDVEFVPADVPPSLVSKQAKPLLSMTHTPHNNKFIVNNDTLDQENEQNKMFVVVRNVKSLPKGEEVPRFSNEYCINKGDIIKMGRLKFLVKDFRSQFESANIDSEHGCSPCKKGLRQQADIHNDVADEFAAEEEVEIECGIADDSQQIQCKICWCDE